MKDTLVVVKIWQSFFCVSGILTTPDRSGRTERRYTQVEFLGCMITKWRNTLLENPAAKEQDISGTFHAGKIDHKAMQIRRTNAQA
ncbi:hypothetical protein [Sphingobacterium pedocola]|nr:hypothetical protein [Sphingobacterium pedocola]